MEVNPLHKLMRPRSIAFMGASNNITRMGSFLLTNVIGGGFEGPIYPVHPREETVLGLKAYRRIADLPEVPDLLVLVIPTRLVPEVMEEAGRKGIDRVIVVSGGYEEVDSEEGRRRHLPHTGAGRNPVDLTYSREEDALLHHLPKLILGDDRIDGLLLYGVFGADWLLQLDEMLGGGYVKVDREALLEMGRTKGREFLELVRTFGKPVLGATFMDHSDSMVRELARGGVPLYPGPERAARAMAAMYRDRLFLDRVPA